MSILKIVTNPYDSPEAAANLIHYMYRKSKYNGGLSIDPKYAIEQMDMLRQCFDQTTGRLIYHFILAFSPVESSRIPSMQGIIYTAYEICEYFASEYQIVFSIHYKDYRWHIHFALNPVSFVTGKKYRADKYSDRDLACVIRDSLYVSSLETHYGCQETLDDLEL